MAERKNPFDVQHVFFTPLWRRVVFVGALALWTLFELSQGNHTWALVFGAAAAYCGHQFFWAFNPKDPDAD